MAGEGGPVVSRWPVPTVTLGELYLAQGHRREAAEIFEQILRGDPGNRRAREGLEGLRRRGKGKPAAAGRR